MNYTRVGNIINNNPPPKKDFTQISNKIIFSTLDPFEKLVLIYLLSVPPIAEINHETIQVFTGIGNYGVKKACKSLQESGLLKVEKIATGNGYFKYQYIINDLTNILETNFNRSMISTNGDTINRSMISTNGDTINRSMISTPSYKDNTIKNKTNINTNNKDIREKQIQQITKIDLEKAYDNFDDDTETSNDKLNSIIETLVNDFQIKIETANDLVKKAKAKENGLDNLQANINFFLPEKAYLKNITGRFITAVKDNFVYQKFSNDDIEDKKRYLKEQENKVIERYKCIYDLADKSIVKDLTKNNLPNILLNVLFDTKIFFECNYTEDDIKYQNSVTMQLSNIPRIDFTNEILRIIEGDKKYLISSYEFKEMFKDCQNDNEILTKLENKLDYLYF